MTETRESELLRVIASLTGQLRICQLVAKGEIAQPPNTINATEEMIEAAYVIAYGRPPGYKTEAHNAALRGGEAVPLESTVMQQTEE